MPKSLDRFADYLYDFLESRPLDDPQAEAVVFMCRLLRLFVTEPGSELDKVLHAAVKYYPPKDYGYAIKS